jgi:tetratricopeptide (TPR) repeat protein
MIKSVSMSRRTLSIIALTGATLLLAFYVPRSRGLEPPPGFSEAEFEPAVGAALYQFKQQALVNPESIDAWQRLAFCFAAHGGERRAIICLHNLMVLDPDNPQWPFLAGCLTAKITVPAQAIPLFQQACLISHNPHENIENHLAESLLDNSQYEKSAAYCRGILSREPQNARALFNLGICLLRMNKPAEGIARLRSCQSLVPHFRPAAAALAAAFQSAGDTLNAKQQQRMAAQASLQVWPEPLLSCIDAATIGELASRTLAESLSVAGSLADAEQILHRAIERHPESKHLPVDLASNLLAQHRPADALKILQQFVGKHPAMVESRFYLAIALEALARYSEAEQEVRTVIERFPRFHNARLLLARIQRRTKQFAESESTLRETLISSPAHAESHRDLGLLLAELRRYPEAIESLNSALAAAPDDQRIATLIDIVEQQARDSHLHQLNFAQ